MSIRCQMSRLTVSSTQIKELTSQCGQDRATGRRGGLDFRTLKFPAVAGAETRTPSLSHFHSGSCVFSHVKNGINVQVLWRMGSWPRMDLKAGVWLKGEYWSHICPEHSSHKRINSEVLWEQHIHPTVQPVRSRPFLLSLPGTEPHPPPFHQLVGNFLFL